MTDNRPMKERIAQARDILASHHPKWLEVIDPLIADSGRLRRLQTTSRRWKKERDEAQAKLAEIQEWAREANLLGPNATVRVLDLLDRLKD